MPDETEKSSKLGTLFGVSALMEVLDDIRAFKDAAFTQKDGRMKILLQLRCEELLRLWPNEVGGQYARTEMFEHIKNPNGIALRCIRFKRIKGSANPRFLYTAYQGKPLLLCAFAEKNTRADYKAAVSLAERRFERLERNG